MFQRSLPLRPLLLLCSFLLAFIAVDFAQSTTAFPNPTVIPTGNWPAAIYTADINGDGIPDLVYIDTGAQPNLPSVTHILLGDGHGGFSPAATLSTIGRSVAIGDLTGNGHIDIGWLTYVVVPEPPGVFVEQVHTEIARGSGTGTFAAPERSSGFFTLGGTSPPVFDNLLGARLRVSGPSDIAATESGSNFVLVFRTLPGIVSATYSKDLPDGVGPLLVTDLNGDGRPDLIVNSLAAQTAQVFLGDGDGIGINVVPSSRFAPTGGIRSLLVQDVNNDGRPDLIAEGPAGHIDVYPGNGDGTFQSTSIGGTGTLDGTTGNGGHLIALADLNHDGQIDALTSAPIGISALLGQGTAYLGLKGIFNAGSGMHTFATADFNGDGNLDIATDSPEGIAILYGNPDGTFQTSQAFAAGAPAESGALGAFTSSGFTDAVVSVNSRQGQLLRGAGDGTFQFFSAAATPNVPQPTTSLAGDSGYYGAVSTGDLDQDGHLDFAVTADGPAFPPNTLSTLGITLQYGRGDGTFAVPAGIASSSAGNHPFYGASVAARGVGLGGFPGVLNLDSAHLWSIANSSFIPFPAANLIASVPSQHPHNRLATGALRKPGLNDLLAQNGGSLKLYLNNGFVFSSTPAGDLAVDGSLTTPGQRTAPDISASFPGPSKALGFNAAIGSMLIADVDGDGTADLLVAYDNLDADHTAPNPAAPNYLYLWFGDGTGHFPVSAAHPVNPVRLTPSRNFYQVAVADINDDGHPDLILSDGYLLGIQYGDGTGSFGPEQHLLAGQGINSLSFADLRSLHRQDLVSAMEEPSSATPLPTRTHSPPTPTSPPVASRCC